MVYNQTMKRLLWMAALASGCGTLTTARPLDPGEHVVGATLGGPVADLGFVTMPLPNLVVQGRSGLSPLAGRPLEVDYGLNLTAAAFGVVGAHVGGSWQLLDQQGGVPALTLSERMFVYDSHLSFSREADVRASYFLNQSELLASWDTRRALLYVGVGNYLDFGEPRLLLTPALGASLHLGPQWDLQLEGRAYAVGQTKQYNGLRWVSLGSGALGGTLSVSRRFGGTP